MGIDNSGDSFIFDVGTIQAIEEGKNRISLINAEIERITRLQISLNAEVVSIHAEIEYSKTNLEALTQKITEATANLEALTQNFALVQTQLDVAKAQTDGIHAEREADLAKMQDQKTALDASIASNDALTATLATREGDVIARETAITEKENKFKEFIINV